MKVFFAAFLSAVLQLQWMSFVQPQCPITGGVRYKNLCFWVIMEPAGLNFAEAEQMCRGKNAYPANIYSAEHYNDVMDLLHGAKKEFYYIYLGMQYKNLKLLNYDGSTASYGNWRPGDPITWMSRVAIDIFPDPKNELNGMLTSRKEWKKKGVLCETRDICVNKENHVMRGSTCFWVEMAPTPDQLSYKEAETLCRSKGATPANIYDSKHYQNTMSLLRKEKDEFYYVYLGMDHQGGKLTNYDGSPAEYSHWRLGDPRPTLRDDEPMVKVAIDVFPDESNSGNGMLTSVPSWKKKGVVCEQINPPCYGIEDSFAFGGKCYWRRLVDVVFSKSVEVCAEDGGTPANIYDDNHYNKIMALLRKNISEFYYVFTGMDYENEKLKFYNGTAASYARWRANDPRPTLRDDEPMIKVAIDIYVDDSNSGNGMLTSVPNWVKKGVICER